MKPTKRHGFKLPPHLDASFKQLDKNRSQHGNIVAVGDLKSFFKKYNIFEKKAFRFLFDLFLSLINKLYLKY